MSPALTFFVGLLLLILFGWYLASDLPVRKRWLGLVLSVLLVAFCLEETIPPSKKIKLGLDLRGGTSFLIRLRHSEMRLLRPICWIKRSR